MRPLFFFSSFLLFFPFSPSEDYKEVTNKIMSQVAELAEKKYIHGDTEIKTS
ncbi:hypothetical protein KKC65_02395 [Patescibacteria group bacterium]|nr:hypothetical protein [Patescibacteria group bacterium]